MKTKEEIRATTTGKIPRPENYRYGEKLAEWDASLPAGAEALLSQLQPINDRILVRLLDVPETLNRIVLTDPKPLIGGECREAIVLKCGPGKWGEGGWWKVEEPEAVVLTLKDDMLEHNNVGWWRWFPAERRPMSVKPGQTVYIGNWVDLEADGLALCQEGDVRGIADSAPRFDVFFTAKKENYEVQTAKDGARRAAQVSKGRNKRGTGRGARLSHAAKAL